jgi:hypothetical protein
MPYLQARERLCVQCVAEVSVEAMCEFYARKIICVGFLAGVWEGIAFGGVVRNGENVQYEKHGKKM